MTSLLERFTAGRLIARAVVALSGAGVIVAGFLWLHPELQPAFAGLFGLWVTCLAPFAFQLMESKDLENTETSPPA